MARLVTFAAFAAAAALVPPAAHARPGDVDATFGVGGQSVFVPGDNPGADTRGLAQQHDGKLLVSGNASFASNGAMSAIVNRVQPGGGLDRAFGEAGMVRLPMRFSAADPIVLADGRIVLVGDASDRQAAVRLLPGGGLDSSFGEGGLATVPGGDGRGAVWGAFSQSDGKLVLLGQDDPPGDADWGATATRLMPDGSLDASFGDGGRRRLEVPSSGGLVYDGVEQADGTLVIAGEFDRRDTQIPDYHWTLIRLTPDGSKDPSFGDGGVAQGFFFGQGGTFGDFAVQPDGKLLLAGGAQRDDGYGWGIARALPDGRPDPSFGDGGGVWMRPPGTDPANPLIGSADRLVVQKDGRIVVSGNRTATAEGFRLISGWALARLTRAGSLDPDFGDGGWSPMAMGNRLWPSGLVRTPDGKVVVSGDARDCGYGAVALVRFHAENEDAGRPDGGPAMHTCDPVIEAEPDGDLPIEVQCPMTEDVCRGAGEVEIPSADLPVGRKSFKLRGARSGTLTIRASRRARRFIARPRGVRAEIVYRTKDGDGNRNVTRRKLRLRRG